MPIRPASILPPATFSSRKNNFLDASYTITVIRLKRTFDMMHIYCTQRLHWEMRSTASGTRKIFFSFPFKNIMGENLFRLHQIKPITSSGGQSRQRISQHVRVYARDIREDSADRTSIPHSLSSLLGIGKLPCATVYRQDSSGS